MTDSEKNGDSNDFYFIDTKESYKKSSPSPLDNLITLYGLDSIAHSVARINPDGSKGVKLRKSYKSHIQDLSGKHQIPKERTISPIVFDPNRNAPPNVIKKFDVSLLNKSLSFEKTSINGIPGFDSSQLAVGDQSALTRDDLSDGDDFGSAGKKGKRKKKTALGGDTKRLHV